MPNNHGFGKTILFGEHFVVHGLPAIVASLEHTMQSTIEKSDHFSFIDETKKFPGVPTITWKIGKKAILKILDHLHVPSPEETSLKITLHGNLPMPNGGIGSSAAALVTLARAVSSFHNLNLSEEEINQAAFEGEKEIHGNPSGIDNTAATYGGTFLFKQNNITWLCKPEDTICQKTEIVLVESGKSTDTKTVIEAVQTFIKEHKSEAKNIFAAYEKLVGEAHDVLTNKSTRKLYDLGELMNKNHDLLQKLTVSCKELDKVVAIAKKAGALGAKLTGTGRGGLAVALTPGKNLQEKVAQTLEKSGYTTLKTRIRL